MVKKIIKGYLPGFITGIIVCGTVSVLAMTYFPSSQTTYDNSESGLKSTDVQGAIDELYNTCVPQTAGEQIIENGKLEKDQYECRYFFKGTNPNNYITFNNETAGWRIISVECDGTIKIMRNESIGDMAWDSNNSNNWDRPADLNTYLNNKYLNSITVNKDKIISHTWSIGETNDTYNNDMLQQVQKENSIKSQSVSIGMITVSEYIRANSNTNQCGSTQLNYDNASICRMTNWICNINTSVNGLWTISVTSNYNIGILGSTEMAGAVNWYNAVNQLSVSPALYLSSDIEITGGDGSQNDQYTIAN